MTSVSERRLVFSQNVMTGSDNDVKLGQLGDKSSQVEEEDKDVNRMIPMIIIFSCLTTVLVFIMIIVTLVKRSSEYSKGSGLQTHVAFNKNLDKDIEPDIINHTKHPQQQAPGTGSSMHKVYSLDQLNQVSFEGFTSASLNPNLVNSSKYNTLPARQIAIIESIYNNQSEQAPLIQTPKSILVKKVTFEKPASSSSSNTSTPTMDLSSYNECHSLGHYMDMGQLNSGPSGPGGPGLNMPPPPHYDLFKQ